MELISNAMVREVLTDKNGLATGVSYVDRETLQEYEVNAKTVVLGASSCETARIMLNSKSAALSKWLGNSSGLVGRYLQDSTGASRSGMLAATYGPQTI